MALSVVVLAAGEGRRMKSNLPKVLQPLSGRPLLHGVLETARVLGPDAIHIVYGHGGERVRAAFPDSDLAWCLQAEQLGTGHAVSQALPAIPDEHQVLVLCGDVPLVRAATLERLVERAGADALAILTTCVDDPTGYGRVVRDRHERVIRIVEEQDASPEQRRIEEINAGLMAARAAALRRWLGQIDNDNAQGEYYLTDVIDRAVAERVPVHGLAAEDPAEALGINDKLQLALAERVLQRRTAQTLMSGGVTLADPDRIEVRGALSVGMDVFIDVGVVFEGHVELGDGVHIGPHAVIANSRLGDGCRVHAHSVIDGAITGANCEIGPFARLRPGTEFAERVKVGNFVEVKNSQVAAGSKMNHLSYVGDTSVGRDVNVGAGTITCNYDGASKHRTIIGSDAFIGSGVMLVAPVEVGAGATIGAGSTINQDAPAGELTLARARQTTVKGWTRPAKHKK